MQTSNDSWRFSPVERSVSSTSHEQIHQHLPQQAWTSSHWIREQTWIRALTMKTMPTCPRKTVVYEVLLSNPRRHYEQQRRHHGYQIRSWMSWIKPKRYHEELEVRCPRRQRQTKSSPSSKQRSTRRPKESTCGARIGNLKTPATPQKALDKATNGEIILVEASLKAAAHIVSLKCQRGSWSWEMRILSKFKCTNSRTTFKS